MLKKDDNKRKFEEALPGIVNSIESYLKAHKKLMEDYYDPGTTDYDKQALTYPPSPTKDPVKVTIKGIEISFYFKKREKGPIKVAIGNYALLKQDLKYFNAKSLEISENFKITYLDTKTKKNIKVSYAPTKTERLSRFLSKIMNFIMPKDSHKEDSKEIKNGGVSQSSSALEKKEGTTKTTGVIGGIDNIRSNDPEQGSTNKSSEKITK